MALFTRDSDLLTLFNNRQDTRTSLFFTPDVVSLPFSLTRSTTEGGWELEIEGTQGQQVIFKNSSDVVLETITLTSMPYTFDIRDTGLIDNENETGLVATHLDTDIGFNLTYQQDDELNNIGIQDITVTFVSSGLDSTATASLLYNYDTSSIIYYAIAPLVNASVSNFTGGTGDYVMTFDPTSYGHPGVYTVTVTLEDGAKVFKVFNSDGVQVSDSEPDPYPPTQLRLAGAVFTLTNTPGSGTGFDPTNTTGFTVTISSTQNTLTKQQLVTDGQNALISPTITQSFVYNEEKFPPIDLATGKRVTQGLTEIPVLSGRKAFLTSFNSDKNTYSEPKYEEDFNYDVGDDYLSFSDLFSVSDPTQNHVFVAPNLITIKGRSWHDIVSFTFEIEYDSTKMVYDASSLVNQYGYTLSVNADYGGAVTLDKKMRVTGQIASGYAGAVIELIKLPFIINQDVDNNDFSDPRITCVDTNGLSFFDNATRVIPSLASAWSGIESISITNSGITITKTAAYPAGATQPWGYAINGGARFDVPITTTTVSVVIASGSEVTVYQPISGDNIVEILPPPTVTSTFTDSTYDLSFNAQNVQLPWNGDLQWTNPDTQVTASYYQFTATTNPYSVGDVRDLVNNTLLGYIYTLVVNDGTGTYTFADSVDLSYPTDTDGTSLGGQEIVGFDLTYVSGYNYDYTDSSKLYATGSTLYHDVDISTKAGLIASGQTNITNTFDFDQVNDIVPTTTTGGSFVSDSLDATTNVPRLTDRPVAAVLYDSTRDTYSPLYQTTQTLDIGSSLVDIKMELDGVYGSLNQIWYTLKINTISDNVWSLLRSYDFQLELDSTYINYVGHTSSVYNPASATTAISNAPYDVQLNLTESGVAGRAGLFNVAVLKFEYVDSWSTGTFPIGNGLGNNLRREGDVVWANNKGFSSIAESTFTWNGITDFTISQDGTSMTMTPSGSFSNWTYDINGGTVISAGSSSVTNVTFATPLSGDDVVTVYQPINGTNIQKTYVVPAVIRLVKTGDSSASNMFILEIDPFRIVNSANEQITDFTYVLGGTTITTDDGTYLNDDDLTSNTVRWVVNDNPNGTTLVTFTIQESLSRISSIDTTWLRPKNAPEFDFVDDATGTVVGSKTGISSSSTPETYTINTIITPP